MDVVRRESRRRVEAIDETHDAVDSAAAVDEQAEQGMARDQVRAALSRLTEPHQEVLQLAYFAGYTQSELAERLAVPIGTIKSRTFAAITAVREQIIALERGRSRNRTRRRADRRARAPRARASHEGESRRTWLPSTATPHICSR